MSYILCLETSGVSCSVSLVKNSQTIALKHCNTGNFSHAENLHIFIEDILKENSLSPSDFCAIAISEGPGSYTGLRIGVASAKGLCYAWSVPLIALPTLEILARNVKNPENNFVIPLLDARRMEVYCSVFQNNIQISEVEAKILTESSFSEYLEKGKVIFLGDGSKKFSEICHHPNAIFLPNEFPSAQQMGELAFTYFKQNKFENIAYHQPFYLKNFQVGK